MYWIHVQSQGGEGLRVGGEGGWGASGSRKMETTVLEQQLKNKKGGSNYRIKLGEIK